MPKTFAPPSLTLVWGILSARLSYVHSWSRLFIFTETRSENSSSLVLVASGVDQPLVRGRRKVRLPRRLLILRLQRQRPKLFPAESVRHRRPVQRRDTDRSWPPRPAVVRSEHLVRQPAGHVRLQVVQVVLRAWRAAPATQVAVLVPEADQVSCTFKAWLELA